MLFMNIISLLLAASIGLVIEFKRIEFIVMTIFLGLMWLVYF